VALPPLPSPIKRGVGHEGCWITLVTGANRGLGLAFAKALVEMGASKVYAAARNPEAGTRRASCR
jgi:NADP-dependent 3-hydroxy acid dehydrogenase YdfG